MMRVVVFLVLLAAVAAFNAMPTRSFSVSSSACLWKCVMHGLELCGAELVVVVVGGWVFIILSG